MPRANIAGVLSFSETRRRHRLGVLVVVWGVQAMVTQSLLLREAQVLMFGSEFAWGVVLFAWLFGVATGAAVGMRLAQGLRRPDIALVMVLLGLSAAACVELWIFRGARGWLGVAPGELLPLPKTALAAVVFISPASALVGLAFPLACCIGRRPEPQASACAESPRGLKPAARTPLPTEPQASACAGGPRGLGPAARALLPTEPQASACAGSPRGLGPAARTPLPTEPQASACAGGPRGLKPAARTLLQLGSVYALESAGSLIGGAAFSFWAVEHLTPIATALACAAITAAASAGLLAAGTRRSRGAALLDVAALALLATMLLAGDGLNRRLVQRRWRNVAPGYELVAEAESKYQNLAVGRLAEQFTLYCDGHVSADFPDPYTFVPLAHLWMCQHPQPDDVLVLGGGAEGLLAEILRHPVKRVDYVEPDPRQIELIEPYLTDADRAALADPRVTVHHADARYYVKTQRERFDLVIARLPEPTSALRARFYTDEFYAELRRAMKPRAVLCTTVTAAPGELPAASGEYLASVRATSRRHFPYLIVGWGDPAHVLAATAEGLLSTDPAELTRRYEERGVEAELFDPAWFDGATDWFDPAKLARRAAELDAIHEAPISTDQRPRIYLQRLTLWDRMTGGEHGLVIERLRSVSLGRLIAVLAAVAVAALAVCRLRHRGPGGWATGAVIVSVGSTGLATMALSIVWLFAFQNLYGYVYQRIGWIIAVFMGGLVIGCTLAGRGLNRATERGRLQPYLRQRLIGVDILLALLAAAVPFLLPMLGALQSGPTTFVLVEWCVLVMVALTGVLGGAVFPLAGRWQLEATGRIAAAAGSVDSADHAGACLGALLCGILLVPVFGTAVAAFLLAGLKLASALLLAIGWRLARQP